MNRAPFILLLCAVICLISCAPASNPGHGNRKSTKALVILTITSEPSGARVTDAERGYLGMTPLVVEYYIDETSGHSDKSMRHFTFELDGYKTEKRPFKLDFQEDKDGGEFTIAMKMEVALTPAKGKPDKPDHPDKPEKPNKPDKK
jgi:hypothetical protein